MEQKLENGQKWWAIRAIPKKKSIDFVAVEVEICDYKEEQYDTYLQMQYNISFQGKNGFVKTNGLIVDLYPNKAICENLISQKVIMVLQRLKEDKRFLGLVLVNE
ncbi:MAG TPA: hypothetical protein PKE69_27425 [Pyrinomonadaceae bacterium]|nr:hypothetical protein [Pyrinomonadaceae bacterium]